VCRDALPRGPSLKPDGALALLQYREPIRCGSGFLPHRLGNVRPGPSRAMRLDRLRSRGSGRGRGPTGSTPSAATTSSAGGLAATGAGSTATPAAAATAAATGARLGKD
jgi:hypothetical protein